VQRGRHTGVAAGSSVAREGASASSAREALIADTARGGVTLVLGAGVSGSCRVATWRELAVKLWADAFGRELPKVADDPRFYPFVFERVEQAMPDRFARRLKEMLYAGHELPSREELARSTSNTLAVVARVLAHEARLPERRVIRVITLNVDDLLERAVARLDGEGAGGCVQPVVRATFHPNQMHAPNALPVYHLHGFLRSDDTKGPRESSDAPDVLVFTDLQYWASAAMPSSHMNRTFSFALHDSHCVFIGMSMTDLNLWRWLALRAFEIATDCKSQCELERGDCNPEALYRKSLDRHYWITRGSSGDDGFLSECLALRGVRTVPIRAWDDDSFCELMQACFPAARAR
jgi:hypothetical protein